MADRDAGEAGDVDALAGKLREASAIEEDGAARQARRDWAARRFDWTRNAHVTQAIYEELCGFEAVPGTKVDWPAPTLSQAW